jgi:hypothetical protein
MFRPMPWSRLTRFGKLIFPIAQQLERVLDDGLLVVVDRVLGVVDVLALGARRVLDRLQLPEVLTCRP